MWNEVIFAENRSAGPEGRREYGLLRTNLDIRDLVKIERGGGDLDFGILLKNDFYWDTLSLQRAVGDALEIRLRWGAGLTFGSSEPKRFVNDHIKLPRLAVVYSWGDGSESIRFLLRFRY